MTAASVNAGMVLRVSMLPKGAFWKRVGICCGLALSVFSARAEAPPPPREFWDYLMEFSDDKGEVFDPADLAAIAKIPAHAAPADGEHTWPNEQTKDAAAKKPAAEGGKP